MEVRTLLRRDGDQWRCWEVTWEGHDVEIAVGPLEDRGDQGDATDLLNRTFPTPTEAREYVAEQLALRRAEGWSEQTTQHEPDHPPALSAADPELEALIDARPDDPEPYLVYADWLQRRSDPRGELITLQDALAREPHDAALLAAEAALLEAHREHLFGSLTDLREHAELSWRLGFIDRARLFIRGTHKLGLDDESLLLTFLRHPSSRFLRQLVVHRTPTEIWKTRNHDRLVQALIQAGPRPALRQLQIGHPDQDSVCGLPAALWPTLPALETLCIFGGTLEFEPPAAPCGVQTLVIGTWISAENLTALADTPWPRLERLHLTLNTLDPEQLVELLVVLARNAPALRHLGPCKYLQTDALAVALLEQRGLLGQLTTLDLTGGHLSDDTLGRLRQAGAVELLLDTDLEADYRLGWPKSEERDDDIWDDEDDDGDGEDGVSDDYDNEYAEEEARLYGYAEEGQAYAPLRPATDCGVDEGWEELDREDPYDVDDV